MCFAKLSRITTTSCSPKQIFMYILSIEWISLIAHGMSGKQSFCRLSSVHLSQSVMSNSLWPQGRQHARLPFPSTTPGARFNSYPLSWWCHPTISSSVIPFSSCLQSFPATASFSISQFLSGGQNIGVSALTSVLPMNTQDWSPLGWSEVKSLSRVWLFATPWTVAYQAPPYMGFSRQEYWSALPFPSPEDLPDPGIEPGSPTL